MAAKRKAKTTYSKIIIPCQKCGHKSEISLGHSGGADESSSSSESEIEDRPSEKKARHAIVSSRPESSDSSSKDSDSDSSSNSDSDAPVLGLATALSKPQRPAMDNLPATASKSGVPASTRSSDSSSGSSSDSASSSDSSSSSDSDDGRLPKPLDQSSVHQFFSQFPSFKYDSSQPVMSEYFRMSQTQSFKSLPQKARKKARQDLKDALAEDFGRLYGTDVDDLGAWQSLCRVLRFDDVPDDLEECQKLVTATYVNIIDLIDTVSTGSPVQHFDSEKELSEYTLGTGNILSRKSKHAGSLLKFLLRNIFDPSDATRNNPEPLYALGKKRKRRA